MDQITPQGWREAPFAYGASLYTFGQVAHTKEKKIKRNEKQGVVVQNDHTRDKRNKMAVDELMRMKWQI